MTERKPGDRLGTVITSSVLVFGFGLLIFLLADRDTFDGVDKSSDAYQVGYSNIYAANGAYGRALHSNPKYNPYLTMSKSEWGDYAEEQARDGDDGDCDPYGAGTGDWHDYAAGANQALQDIASGRKARFHLFSIDPDCD